MMIKTWISDDWQYVTRSDMSSIKKFRTPLRFYALRTPKEAYNPECLVPTVKHGGGYVTIWAAITWYSAGLISILNGRIIASNCVDILGKQVPPVFYMLFPNNEVIFKNDNSPIHTAGCFQSWFGEYEDALQHIPWPVKSPDINIIETLWSVIEGRVRRRFPSISFLKQLRGLEL